MRLQQIRLSGFKTFVDASVIDLPTNRTALVGPNGAGKSNVIDAVRWVIGERSAKSLRGQVLEDVIFKGSDGRAPSDLASIELLFDEVQGQAGRLTEGRDELSVRRELTREGQSVYRLNGTRCRRRDVLDVFLDTGFTSQGYAIIEQGQISQIVQAKPDELRGYLEEAAGISRYKERRRETELSIESANLNLERANDLRHEREERVAALKRQAKRAKRYRELAAKLRQLEACVAFSRRESARAELASLRSNVSDWEARLNDCETRRGAQASRRDALFADREERNARVSKIQGGLFEAAAEISRVENAMESFRRALNEHNHDLQESTEELKLVRSNLEQSKARLSEESFELITQSALLQQCQADREEARHASEAGEVDLRERRAELEAAVAEESRLRQELALVQADVSVTRDRIAEGESRLRQLELSFEEGESDIVEDLARQLDAAEQSFRHLFDRKERAMARRGQLRDKIALLEADLNEARSNEQVLRQELAALLALAGEAGQTDTEAIERWLHMQNSLELPRLGSAVDVASGWEAAGRTLLSGKTAGVLAPSIESLSEHLESLAAGELLIIERGSGESGKSSPLKKVLGIDAGSLFAGVQVEEKVSEALKKRSKLAEGESIICRDGTWVGRDWIRVNRRHLPESVFDSAPDVAALRGNCDRASKMVAKAAKAINDAREELERVQTELDEIDRDLESAQAARARILAERQLEEVRREDARNRKAEASRQHDDLKQETSRLAGHLREREVQSETCGEALREQTRARQHRETLVAESQAKCDEMRALAQEKESKYQEARLARERLTTSERSLRDSLPQIQGRSQALELRIEQIRHRVSEASAGTPRLEAERGEWLGKRLEIEESLAKERRELERIEARIREQVDALRATEDKLGELRGQREESRVQAGAVQARIYELESRIERLGVSEDDVAELRLFLQDLSADEIEEKRLDAERSLARLGEVNLAATEDLNREQQHYDELVAQIDDLERSLETLGSALERIDDDMVKRFRTTYEQANEGLSIIFPKLFGGGKAQLEMTGTRLLETGVTFMANPPGKRNSNIALLSGGEKAMAAIALIFSLFRLNPSPVCLLDEVDAPLDDDNVMRFVDLIRNMSGEVQFVIITHNKLTMEMADNLIGVTMREPGVSRLVSVDINEAASLAASP